MKPDAETAKVMTDAQHLSDLIGSEGWKLARRKLYEKLVELDSVDAMLMDRDPESVMRELMVRKSVIQVLREWIREVEGEAASAAHNAKTFTDERRDDMILELDRR